MGSNAAWDGPIVVPQRQAGGNPYDSHSQWQHFTQQQTPPQFTRFAFHFNFGNGKSHGANSSTMLGPLFSFIWTVAVVWAVVYVAAVAGPPSRAGRHTTTVPQRMVSAVLHLGAEAGRHQAGQLPGSGAGAVQGTKRWRSACTRRVLPASGRGPVNGRSSEWRLHQMPVPRMGVCGLDRRVCGDPVCGFSAFFGKNEGLIFTHHHASGVDTNAAYDIPHVPELDRFYMVGVSEHTVAAHIQDIPENGADIAHLNVLHRPLYVRGLQWLLCHKWAATWQPRVEGSGDDDATVTGGRGGKIPQKKGGGAINGGGSHQADVTIDQEMHLLGKVHLKLMDIKTKIAQVGPSLVVLRYTTAFGRVVILETVLPLRPMLQKVTHAVFCERAPHAAYHRSCSLPRDLYTIRAGRAHLVQQDVPAQAVSRERGRCRCEIQEMVLPVLLHGVSILQGCN